MTTYAIRGYPCTQSVLLDFDAGQNVTWSVFDSKGTFVVGGSAIQNQTHPTEYNSIFTIPDSAFVENDGSKYSIEWKTSSGFVRDTFLVFPSGEPVPKSSVTIAMQNSSLYSVIALPFKATSIKASLYKFDGTLLEVKKCGDECYSEVGNSFKYDVSFSTRASWTDTLGRPYIVMWDYTTLAGSGTEMYQIYCPHFRELKWISDAKTYLDLLNNYDVQPAFRITPEVLLPFVGMALDRINGIGSASNWNVLSLPTNLDYALQMCLRHEYINARYIAEGLSAFDFQGASTQLNVDKTQYWQTKMDEIGSWINENLEKLKNNVIRAGSAGVLNLSLTPSLNWSPLTGTFGGWWSGSALRLLGFM